MPDKETFLITGANGFVGGWLVESLYLKGCANVRPGVRHTSTAVRLSRFPLQPVLADVMKPDQLAGAMEGVDRVVHTAYGSKRVTVEGTRNVLEAALNAGVQRLVYLSSAVVYGNAEGVVDEIFPTEKNGDEYTASKVEAEELCWEYADRGLPVTVIRPSIIYGPFGRMWTVDLASKLQSGNWGIFEGYGDGVCNMVYVGDLVEGILAAAHHPAATGEAFNLVGPDTVTWNDYFKRYNAALGLPELPTVNPGGARLRTRLMEPVRSTARFVRDHYEKPLRKLAYRFRPARMLMKSAETSLKTTPRWADLQLYNLDARYSGDKARTLIGYEPRVDLDRGLALTVGWLRQVGLAGEANGEGEGTGS
ncbi:MAG TPA: NAD-dependent epimerase/dehydratase family protein [Anaerolineae bacterium]|nr:NAD-dependent epimerase/dehydratase family protein [Anaerolineae bacterium]